jgi:hypothetical protein
LRMCCRYQRVDPPYALPFRLGMRERWRRISEISIGVLGFPFLRHRNLFREG